MRVLAYFRSRAALRRRVHAAAQLDLRDGLLEARADRIAELEALLTQERIEKAQLLADLATYKTVDFMRQALRLRRRLAEEKTAERPAPGYPARHRPAAPTEFHPRAVQRRDAK